MEFSFFKKKRDEFDYAETRTCKNCGEIFQGKFCNRCGEKVIDVSDRSFGKMAESLLNAFTFLEGKFWKSFKLIVVNPGKLANQIQQGVQVPYMKLVGLFFVANFFYFLFPVFDTFNSSLYSQYNLQGYSPMVKAMVDNYVASSGVSVKEFSAHYNAHSGNLAKLLLLFLVFILSLPLSLINFSRRNTYFDHLQISFEFHAFQLLVCSVILPHLLKWAIRLAAGWGNANWEVLLDDTVFSTITRGFFFYFWVRAQRTYYHHNWIVSVAKGAVLSYLIFYSWSLYRLILFFLTFWTM